MQSYYFKLFSISGEVKKFDIPPGFLEKAMSSPSFITAPYLSSFLDWDKNALMNRKRPIDLHARLGSKGSEWYSKMRSAANNAVIKSKITNVKNIGFVKYREYLFEIMNSKMTFSPFGYGESCWRDFEAISLGSLLLKPDMSHLTSNPNLFIPNETYIPIKWDFSDFSEKASYYLNNENERLRIVGNALTLAQQYKKENKFLDYFGRLAAATSARVGQEEDSKISLPKARLLQKRRVTRLALQLADRLKVWAEDKDEALAKQQWIKEIEFLSEASYGIELIHVIGKVRVVSYIRGSCTFVL